MKKTHSTIFNHFGFSLIETLVGFGLLALVLLATSTFMVSTLKSTIKTTNQVVKQVDITNAEIQILKDLKQVFPSFSFMYLKDDSGNNFFDIMTNEYEFLVSTAKPTAFRTKTLSADGDEILFSKYNLNKGVGIPYDPVWAYSFAPISTTDPNAVTGFTFIGLESKTNKIISSKLLEPVANGDIFLFDSPTPFKTLSGNIVDVTKPLKYSHYAFFVTNKNTVSGFSTPLKESLFAPVLSAGTIKNTHPVTDSKIDTGDSYLQTLPPVSGAIPLIIIKPLSFVKYKILKTTKNTLALHRQELIYTGSKFQFVTPGRAVIDNVISVKFDRFSMQSPQIKVTIFQDREGNL